VAAAVTMMLENTRMMLTKMMTLMIYDVEKHDKRNDNDDDDKLELCTHGRNKSACAHL
jgi:hypothetical protein